MSGYFGSTVPVDGVRGHGNSLILAFLAGLAAAVVGAGIWMGITVATGLHVGYVALGVGALVGFAVRFAGNGTHAGYGIIGATFTALGCIAGEVLAVIWESTSPQVSFPDAFAHVDLSLLITNIVTKADPITYLIYGIGIFEGYKLSIRR